LLRPVPCAHLVNEVRAVPGSSYRSVPPNELTSACTGTTRTCASRAHSTKEEGPTRRRSAQSPRRTKFGHGTFCGVRSAVRLGLQLPSIFRRRRNCFGGFGLGVALSGAQRRRGVWVGQGRVRHLRPSDFCAVAGRERASRPTRRAKWAKILFALGSRRHSEISSRRADRAAT
jgi:hypothetical protein